MKTPDGAEPRLRPGLSRRDILSMLASGADLSNLMAAEVDLSSDAMQRESQSGYPNSIAWMSEVTRGIDFRERALDGANFSGGRAWRADFRAARLANADFTDSDVGDSLFTGADLTGASFRHATVARCRFDRATLNAAHFENANLQLADLSQARFDKLYLSGAVLEKTIIRRDQVARSIGEDKDEHYDQAVLAYAALKSNFRSLGLFEDASWAYLCERRAETKSRAPWRTRSPRGWKGFWAKAYDSLRWVGSCTVGTIAGYGERPGRAFAFIPVLVLVFASMFMATDSLQVVTNRGAYTHASAGYGQAAEHSLASFVTMSASRVQPRNDVGQVLTNLEALSGVSLVALTMFSLGKRITRT